MTQTKLNPVFTRFYKLFLTYYKTRDFYDLPDSVEIDNCLYRINKIRVMKKFISGHSRLIVYAKDVEMILGKADYDSRNVLEVIRKESGLPSGAPVLINDFCEHTCIDSQVVYKFMNIDRPDKIEDPFQLPQAWEKYFKTRDWYDIPYTIDTNSLLHLGVTESLHKREPGVRPRIIVYPKDIEVYYNYSADESVTYLQDVRRSQGLSISIPVMIGDVNSHNQRQDNKFLSFIMDN